MNTELRVFISSTFRDLQAERDYLIKKVFPELRATCRERGITLTEIDLRWGLTEEESVYGNIIRRCLEEVDRCRPWFICITGSRYGYVPTLSDIHRDPELLKRFPWIEEAAVEEMSIMEMEVRYGAIGMHQNQSGMMNPSARFYFRQTGLSDDPVPAKHPAEAAQLQAMKESVVEAGGTVRQFQNAAMLGRLVHDDLLALIQERFPLTPEASTPLQRERRRHETFAISRRQSYIPRVEILAQLNRLAEQGRANAESPNNPPHALNAMVVVAPSGSGKSALVAYWAEQYRRRYPEAFVVEHYIGIGAEHSQQREVVQHLMMEIRERGLMNDPIPDSTDALHKALPEWLATIQGQPMIVLIDGVNQLGNHARGVAWIPEHLPPNVVMVVTTTDPITANVLVERGWGKMQIEPLQPDERQAVIVRFLGESYKALNTRQLRRISTEAHCSHPLFLRTFLEELRVFGHHDRLDEQIDWYLSADDTHDLFQRMLQRMEGDFGERTVRQVMTLLWGARRGLTESELAAMTHGSRLLLSSLIASLDYHLVNRDGILAFFHDYLRTAVERRYLPTPAKQRSIHRRIAGYFSGQPITERRIQEEPWQWHKANDANNLHTLLTDLAIFDLLWQQEKLHLLEYWRFLERASNPAESYRAAVVAIEQAEPERAVVALHQLAAFLLAIDRRGDAEDFARHSVRLARLHQHPELQKSLIGLGEILRQGNHFAEAEHVAREAVQQPTDSDGPANAVGLDLLSNILLDSGDFTQAEALLRSALENLENAGEHTTQESLDLYGNLGLLFHYRGRFHDAEQVQRKLLRVYTQRTGDNTPDIADISHNLGRVLFDIGRLEEALWQFQRAADIWQRDFGPHHSLSLLAQTGIADVLFRQGNYQAAMELYRAVLSTRQRLLGNKHLHTVQSGAGLGVALRNLGQLQEAETLYRELLATLQEIVEPHHQFTIACMNNLASVLLQQKKYSQAAELLDEVLSLHIAIHGELHGDVVAMLLLVSEVRMQEGRNEEAREITQRAVQISQQVLGHNHHRTATAIRRLGTIIATLGDVTAAERFLRQALHIYQQALGENHPNTKSTLRQLQQMERKKGGAIAIEP
ncbi:MAG: tetratricopeptide repeat protein [Chlorobi bacterium]|nr:tetratricopeptide repeat protein [Chlorobiota bacterium]